MQLHLTDLAVRTLKPGYYWDEATPGFGIRVGKKAKAWTIIRGNTRERLTIGRYPTIPLIDARKEARRLLCIEVELRTEAPSFADAKTLFLDEHYRDRSRRSKSDSIGEVIEHNIELATLDPVARGGFTQVPNFILRDGTLSLGAKVAYSMFLHFAWNNESCFPGQDRLAQHMGMSVPRVNEYIKELKEAGLVEITRRGQGKTNLYRVNFAVRNKRVQRLPNSRFRPVEI